MATSSLFWIFVPNSIQKANEKKLKKYYLNQIKKKKKT
jgi:hypothetical protein